ncbi:MAG TPA: right-handed parallel beta-helix repeat-containing protein [Chitinophagales bacterium]|nr:right-handed parallel beta-helix repeat-containing protein [Chitinophagales bacterium]
MVTQQKAKKLLYTLLLVLAAHSAEAGSFYINPETEYVDGKGKTYNHLQPGDTLILEPGKREAIAFANINGAAGKSIVIMNGTGLCEINSAKLPYGISLRDCHYIKLCGAGWSKEAYGIKIAEVKHSGAGLGVSDKSDNVDVSFIEIAHTNGPGLLCKTDPTCSTDRWNSVQYNISIHNNYIHHTGTEGLYIGSTAFEGVPEKCDSVKKILLPPLLIDVSVYDNTVDYTGWDGIQISNAQKVNCHGNKIYHDSQKQQEWQNCGLIIGGGASGKFYNNTIAHGLGYGINCFGNDLVEITGNQVTMDSAQKKCAIYLNDKLSNKATHYVVRGNLIITSFAPAIKAVNKRRNKPDEVIANKITGVLAEKAISY